MTLRRKMGFQIVAMIAGLLLISGTALWGLDALREDYGLAVSGYEQLKKVYEVGSHLATARTLLVPEHLDRVGARAETERAAELYELFVEDKSGVRMEHDREAERAVKAALTAAEVQLATPPEGQAGEYTPAADDRAINAAIGKIGALASGIGDTIKSHQRSANHKHAVTVKAVAVVSLVVVLAAVFLGFMQYRGVTRPLGALRTGVRKIASGHFAQRLTLHGGEEFVELADEFNQMASELDGFYHQLEQKVAQKSKELIRSERLASIGYLAAGVAHEINNPLGIISGYAEYSLGRLKKDDLNGASPENSDVAQSLQIIAEEAFRCKDITGKLLSLAGQGEENRRRICLADVADKVVSNIGGLREFRDRKLAVIAPSDPAERAWLTISAVEAEMRQVLLNLAINALEASPPGTGEVSIDVRRQGALVELSVTDNGRGMSPQTLERVFEPFFTEKRGSPDARGSRSHGTGLGLSITHAIVESHGGTIAAHSDGESRGSRFVVRIPAVEEGHESA